MVPVVLRLEDFGFNLTYEAVSLVIEFVYKGEVKIASSQLIVLANAAHSLGIDGLKEFLPNNSQSSPQIETSQKSSIQDCKSMKLNSKTNTNQCQNLPENYNCNEVNELKQLSLTKKSKVPKKIQGNKIKDVLQREEINSGDEIIVLNDDEEEIDVTKDNDVLESNPRITIDFVSRTIGDAESNAKISNRDENNVNHHKRQEKINAPKLIPNCDITKPRSQGVNDAQHPSTSERTSPQSTQPPHSTYPDNEGDYDYHVGNDLGESVFKRAASEKEEVELYEKGKISNGKDTKKVNSIPQPNQTVHGATREEVLQHCSVNSTVPSSSKASSNICQPTLSASSPESSTNNSFSNSEQENVSGPGSGNSTSFTPAIETPSQNPYHEGKERLIASQEQTISKSESSSRIECANTGINNSTQNMLSSCIEDQNCFIPMTSSSNSPMLNTPTNSQGYQGYQQGIIQIDQSVDESTTMKVDRNNASENCVQLLNVSSNPIAKFGQVVLTSSPSNVTTSQTASSVRNLSNFVKSKGKLRVINQVGTLLGNTTPNIQASSNNSPGNFSAFVDEGRNSNCNFNQNQQFFDTLLTSQADATLQFRSTNQFDNILSPVVTTSSDLFMSDGPHISTQQLDYGNINNAEAQLGGEEVTIIEEIAIGNQVDSLPFNIISGTGYQYQQPIHSELNNFQPVAFANEVPNIYHHSPQSTGLHNQNQHLRTQDHPPPPPLWMPTCPPPPLAAAPQQAFSVVAAHAVAQAAVAQHQNTYEELHAVQSNVTAAQSQDCTSIRNSSNPIDNGNTSTSSSPWTNSQGPVNDGALENNEYARRKTIGPQKESKSKKEEYEEVQEYIEVDEEERQRNMSTGLNGVVVRTEPPDLDEVSWGVPDSPNMGIEIHNQSDQPQGDRDSNSGSNHLTSNWSWTTPAEDSIVDWSTRLATMTGIPQNHNPTSTRSDISNNDVTTNWHSLGMSAPPVSSTSLATPSSTISESPPLMLLNEFSSGTQHSSSENCLINDKSPLRIRHPSSDVVSKQCNSKVSPSSTLTKTTVSPSLPREEKSSGLPLLAEVAQVAAAAAVTVKDEQNSFQNQKKRNIQNIGDLHKDVEDSDNTSKLNLPSRRVTKGELEVRRDLTIPSASLQRKSEDEINVFQSDSTPSSSSIDTAEEISVAKNIYSSSNIEQPMVPIKTSVKIMRQRRKNCTECTMTFSTNHRLRQHIKHAHRKEETYPCNLCDKKDIKGKENLKLHMYKNHGVGEIFRCEDCNFETSARVTFTKHTLAAHPTEHNDDAHNESSTGQQFLASGNSRLELGCERDLVIQEPTLNNQNSSTINKSRTNQFNCKYCARAFKSKAGLKLHLQQHTNEVMFSCMVCPFRTPQQQNLVKHLATKHKKGLSGEDLKANKECKLCDFKCVAEYQLKSHILRKHTDRSDMKYKCNDCGYASVEKSALVKHIRFRHTKVLIKYNLILIIA